MLLDPQCIEAKLFHAPVVYALPESAKTVKRPSVVLASSRFQTFRGSIRITPPAALTQARCGVGGSTGSDDLRSDPTEILPAPHHSGTRVHLRKHHQFGNPTISVSRRGRLSRRCISRLPHKMNEVCLSKAPKSDEVTGQAPPSALCSPSLRTFTFHRRGTVVDVTVGPSHLSCLCSSRNALDARAFSRQMLSRVHPVHPTFSRVLVSDSFCVECNTRFPPVSVGQSGMFLSPFPIP